MVALSLALYREDPSPEPISPEQVQATLQTLRNEPHRGLTVVLEVQGEVAGYAFLIRFWSNELGGEVVTIDELYVRPADRGQGQATTLLEELSGPESLWPSPAVALSLEVTPDNHRARALYERLGFRGKNLTLRRRRGRGAAPAAPGTRGPRGIPR